MCIIIVFKHNTNLSTLDKITCMFKWLYKQKYKRTFKRLYKTWTHDSCSLKGCKLSLSFGSYKLYGNVQEILKRV